MSKKAKDKGIEEATKDIQKKVENLEKNAQLVEQYLDQLKRLQAEFDNYKKWAQKEKTGFITVANHSLISDMLPVIDSLKLALNTAENNEFCNGIRMVYKQLMDVLEKNGLKKIECIGRKFDPYKDEIMLQDDSDKEEGTVLEELQEGYMLNDKLIRSAKVKISTGRKNGNNKDNSNFK
jgi:molecular chaperone GrpE